MMTRICGGANSTDGGDIAQQMSDEKNVKTYLDFFCYVKTLAKMCHLAMTVRKEISTKKKVANGEAAIKKFEQQIETAKRVVEALKVYEHMRAEVKRIDDLEIEYLSQKRRNLEKRLNQVDTEIRALAGENQKLEQILKN